MLQYVKIHLDYLCSFNGNIYGGKIDNKTYKLFMDEYQEEGKKKYSDEYIEQADDYIRDNYEDVVQSKVATCMYCGYIFNPKKSIESISYMTNKNGISTALCPNCSLDFLVAANSGYPVEDILFIARCTRLWFSEYSRLDSRGYPTEKVEWTTIKVD